MADLTQAVLSWTANTEPDMASYKIYLGLHPGLFPVSLTQVSSAPTSVILSAGSFNSDGLWYFALSAVDTSNNESARSTAVSKRIVREQSVIRHRR